MAELTDLSAALLLFALLMYLMLDGTDLGAGVALVWFNGEDEKRAIVHSMLPIWDANESWLVLLAAGLLAFFPTACSLLFSALYLPLFVMLLSLVLRAMALEYREKAGRLARRLLDLLLPLSSALAAVTQGICAGAFVSGHLLRGPLGWASPLALLCGFGLLLFYLLLGCFWIRWRVEQAAEHRLLRSGWLLAIMSTLVLAAIVWLQPLPWLRVWSFTAGKVFMTLLPLLLLALCLPALKKRPLGQLIIALIAMGMTAIVVAAGSYPWIVPYEIKLYDVAASEITQRFILYGAAVVIPLTLLYHSWVFWVFSGKVR